MATAIGFSIMGDSLMYGILPLAAPELGISLPLVGVLLSANRLVRLISNSQAGTLFERLGPARPFIGATVLGMVAAVIYGLGWGFAAFLGARIGWGIAWSGLRQGGYDAVWTGPAAQRGKLMGLLWGGVRLGSAISVVLGGFLWDHYGYHTSVGAIAGLTLLAIPIAILIPWPHAETSLKPQPAEPAAPKRPFGSGWADAFKTPARRWLMSTGFLAALFEGVVISTASVFLAARLGDQHGLALPLVGVGTIAGLLLGVRWTSNLLFGPLVGAFSDRFGHARTMVLLAGVTLAGFAGTLSASGLVLVGCLLLIFISLAGFYVTMSAASSNLATRTGRPHLFVGAFTTAIDGGASVGPLLAFNLGALIGFESLYLALGSLLLLAGWGYWWTAAAEFEQ